MKTFFLADARFKFGRVSLAATLMAFNAAGEPAAVAKHTPRLTSATRADAKRHASQHPMVLDLDGQPVDPFCSIESNVVVFIFAAIDCPISNRYAPEVRRLCEQFASRGVTFWLVQPDPEALPDALRQHRKEYGYPCAALRDPQHWLVRKCQVTTTPECAVFTGAGQLVYHGRIDNRQVDFGKARPHATEHDLQDAIEAVLEGRRPVRASVPAIGCFIPALP